ncbi:UNVERIFIED_CONTAM: hypothetical protein PYX00_009605 [Menopon gallinae]|uniref:Coiled-coil domain-containing protein 86 n=1 Tax=Menopon gallinae TaxID=328185 RepID=A0AAW2HBY7_9NEOP
MNKTRGLKQANKFERLKKLKEELKRIKSLTKNIVDARNEEIEQKKERRRKNLKRQEENRLKSEIVQHIKNPAKIKRMKRKHLRNIEKRDTLKMV